MTVNIYCSRNFKPAVGEFDVNIKMTGLNDDEKAEFEKQIVALHRDFLVKHKHSSSRDTKVEYEIKIGSV